MNYINLIAKFGNNTVEISHQCFTITITIKEYPDDFGKRYFFPVEDFRILADWLSSIAKNKTESEQEYFKSKGK